MMDIRIQKMNTAAGNFTGKEKMKRRNRIRLISAIGAVMMNASLLSGC